MKKIILSFLVIILLAKGFSQDTTNSWKLFPGKTDSTHTVDTVFGLVKSYKTGKINVEKDERIDKVSDEMRGGVANQPIIHGYRVQIISSSTKSNVDNAKGTFMTNYRETKSYISYKDPNFRFRAGNFRSKLDAQKFQNEIKGTFPNTLIISDSIELPRLD